MPPASAAATPTRAAMWVAAAGLELVVVGTAVVVAPAVEEVVLAGTLTVAQAGTRDELTPTIKFQ